jgi:HK97 family phage major capsid protein
MKTIKPTTAEYNRAFSNELQMHPATAADAEILRNANGYGGNPVSTPYADALNKQAARFNLFRNLATVLYTNGTSTIRGVVPTGDAAYIEETAPYPDDSASGFLFPLKYHKVGKIATVSTEMVSDSGYDVEAALAVDLGKAFGRAEEKGCLIGDGATMPLGLLADNGGAEIGAETTALTFEDVTKLFFSLPAEYRRNAVWVMSDKTAMMLRTLKDTSGNPLWNQATETIFGKPIYIFEFMPEADAHATAGTKPILFGDLSYYWLVFRDQSIMRTLREKYAATGRIGYICAERFDGRLTKTDAVKALHMQENL